MKPTEILMNEHRVIERVLTCLERIAEDCRRTGTLDADSARKAVDFLRSFADRCHHGKEEDQLFPLMEERGFSPNEGPTAVMRDEHVQGRELIRAMDEAIEQAAAGEPAACASYTDNAGRYVLLLRQHIEKEDHCLFPMADQTLSPADQEELDRRFRRVESEDLGPDLHERYVGIADELSQRWEVAVSRH